MDPYKLNERVIKKAEVLAPSAPGANPKDLKRISPWLPTRWSKKEPPELPVAISPTHIARRISNQRSNFTIHGKSQAGFDRFTRGKNQCLLKIIIPSHAVGEMRAHLHDFGIDETSIYPDLTGLGQALVTRYQNLKVERPHSNVYVRLRPSKLHKGGVGVFAIKPIPKNTKIFADENEEMIWITKGSLPKEKNLRELYNDFAVIKGGRYGCPPSFNRLTPAWFLNNSKKPNTKCDENYDFHAVRDIKTGEELTADYSTYSLEPSRSNAD